MWYTVARYSTWQNTVEWVRERIKSTNECRIEGSIAVKIMIWKIWILYEETIMDIVELTWRTINPIRYCLEASGVLNLMRYIKCRDKSTETAPIAFMAMWYSASITPASVKLLMLEGIGGGRVVSIEETWMRELEKWSGENRQIVGARDFRELMWAHDWPNVSSF